MSNNIKNWLLSLAALITIIYYLHAIRESRLNYKKLQQQV